MFKTPELLQTEPDGSPVDDIVFPVPVKIDENEPKARFNLRMSYYIITNKL